VDDAQALLRIWWAQEQTTDETANECLPSPGLTRRPRQSHRSRQPVHKVRETDHA
jgi:hypothetical protein